MRALYMETSAPVIADRIPNFHSEYMAPGKYSLYRLRFWVSVVRPRSPKSRGVGRRLGTTKALRAGRVIGCVINYRQAKVITEVRLDRVKAIKSVQLITRPPPTSVNSPMSVSA
ncbi:hypothetical protein PoB_006635400 [Plakobranchus ocellatus]|uniref:60S ribosomal protein L35a n=1 Tax=Plakobranchus ocellatus TaxID=259542 RepID=A0AAV4D6M5_9GAST|nr:hypothetical protein PoB_006635400 [Plakobranchus ocellatus]